MQDLKKKIEEIAQDIYRADYEGESEESAVSSGTDKILSLFSEYGNYVIGEDESDQVITSCIHGITSPNVHRNQLRHEQRGKNKI